MIPMDFKWIAKVLGVTENLKDIHENNKSVSNINTDTRTISENEVFLALKGANFDGHKFVKKAINQGATAVIVEKDVLSETDTQGVVQFIVEDTRIALGLLGSAVKAEVSPKTIAITGSVGKTTVKEMTAAILGLNDKVLATNGNFNNDIGVPLTLLRLEQDDEYAVIELGANHLGEIDYTSNLVKPDVATICNVAEAHLEGFGSIETIMRTKGEIIDSLGADGCAVLNADDCFYADWVLRTGQRKVLSFGIENYADIMATNIVCDENGSRFDVLYQQTETAACEIPLLGQHNVLNALSAIAAGLALGLNLEDICAQLKTLPMVDGRLQWVDGADQTRILNDSYNASPASVKAAIDVLALWKEEAWLVLGDMAELGDDSAAIHAEMGEYAQQKGIANFVATGSACRYAVEAFTNAASKKEAEKRSARWFEQQSELLNYINDNKQPGQVFLVKGSRSAGMDKVVKALSVKSSQVIKSDSDSRNKIGEV